MLRFLVKKTGDCGNPSTPKKPKTDAERLATAKEYEERRRRGFTGAWHDEFAYSVTALMRLPDRGVFRKYSNMFMKLVKQNRQPVNRNKFKQNCLLSYNWLPLGSQLWIIQLYDIYIV